MGAEDNLIRDFQKENNILLDAEKQIQKEDKEKEWDLERQSLDYSSILEMIYFQKY